MQKLVLLALVGVAHAGGKIAFFPGTMPANCGSGLNAAACNIPTCYARLSDVFGCNGQTDSWGSDCLGGPPTLTKSVCGSAQIVINNCHDEGVCVDFHNNKGDKARFNCKNAGPTGKGCGEAEKGTCADIGLGKC